MLARCENVFAQTVQVMRLQQSIAYTCINILSFFPTTHIYFLSILMPYRLCE